MGKPDGQAGYARSGSRSENGKGEKGAQTRETKRREQKEEKDKNRRRSNNARRKKPERKTGANRGGKESQREQAAKKQSGKARGRRENHQAEGTKETTTARGRAPARQARKRRDGRKKTKSKREERTIDKPERQAGELTNAREQECDGQSHPGEKEAPGRTREPGGRQRRHSPNRLRSKKRETRSGIKGAKSKNDAMTQKASEKGKAQPEDARRNHAEDSASTEQKNGIKKEQTCEERGKTGATPPGTVTTENGGEGRESGDGDRLRGGEGEERGNTRGGVKGKVWPAKQKEKKPQKKKANKKGRKKQGATQKEQECREK